MFGTWAIPNAALPPDVILEVGPHPCNTRYAAHGTLLSMHSGYLRAALRTVDQTYPNSSGTLRRTLQQQHCSNGATISSLLPEPGLSSTTANSTVLYLPNVTPEQFTPLLTYMYTGYLDLTMENIFGVLLATHLLHMPRALELCRTYLATSSATTTSSTTPCTIISSDLLQRSYYISKAAEAAVATSVANGPRLVRPIASKALATVGLNFIAPPAASQINLLPSAPFRSIEPIPQDITTEHREEEIRDESRSSSQSPISVTQYEDESVPLLTSQNTTGIQQSAVSTSNVDLTFNENEPQRSNEKIAQDNTQVSNTLDDGRKIKHHNTTSLQIAAVKRIKSSAEVGGTSDGGNGVIIDIASCDGPVRFRRVLNVMYGCNKTNRTSDCNASPAEDLACSTDLAGSANKNHSCSTRYVSSFHQQMARNISNTGKLSYASSSSSSSSSLPKNHHQHTDAQKLAPSHLVVCSPQQDEKQKDENSQEDTTLFNTTNFEGNTNYTCVYCKHTFKSHYCYQKHAKRHLIPLCLDNRTTTPVSSTNEGSTSSRTPASTSVQTHSKAYGVHRRTQPVNSGSNNSSTFKREVKPLDMNVQYYPCKTCGSKFPSYYFVHKHRKLCHTEEEDEAMSQNTSRISNSTIQENATGVTRNETNNLSNEHIHDDVSDQQPDTLTNLDRTAHQIQQQG